jgi:UDP-N-acetylglucosamine--N-acetylmuramyl-(pentapeptide) pyrophosphoryl-undecaprenol N-acetylglucosamine transferase
MQISRSNYHIVITGGHLTPALAMIEEFSKFPRKWKISFIGRQKSQEGSHLISREYIEITKMNNVNFVRINTGKLVRHFSRYALASICKFPMSLIASYKTLKILKPDIILSFGGYVALPVALAAWILKIPIVTHEQTQSLGLANQLIRKLAKKVAYAWVGKGKKLYANEVVTGNPIRKAFIVPIQASPKWIIGGKPILFITAGNLGSKIINQIVRNILKELIINYEVVHQCGMGEAGKDKGDLRKLKLKLGQILGKYYHVKRWFSANETSYLMRKSRIVIGRSGANTVYELAFLGAPAILIPLPISAGNEQYENAKILENQGMAVILEQSNLNQPNLLEALRNIEKDYESYKNKAVLMKQNIICNATQKLREVIENVLEEEKKNN